MGTIREVKKKDGTISFHAEVRLRGYPPQRDCFRTKSLAKKWIQDTESAIRDGRHIKTVEAKRHTVGEMIDRFISQWLPKYPERQAKQTALLTWWKNRLGHLNLADLTAATIAEARDDLLAETTVRKQSRSPSTVNRYLASLSKVLSVAVNEYGWLDDSPMRKVSKPKEAPSRDRYLSVEEIDRLLAACMESRNDKLYPLVVLSILTGMRFGEIINLKWEDIDFGLKTITLHKTKNGDRRIIPLATNAEHVFIQSCQYVEGTVGYIFGSNRANNEKGVLSVRYAFEKALEQSGIKNFRWHDLRRTAGSYMAMSGATQGELMEILGHRNPTMTRIYAKFNQQHLRNMLDKSGSKLFKHQIPLEEEND